MGQLGQASGSLAYVSPSRTPWTIVELLQYYFPVEPAAQKELRDFPRCGQPPTGEGESTSTTDESQVGLRNHSGSSGQEWTSGRCKPNATCGHGQGDCNRDLDCYSRYEENVCGDGNCQDFSSSAPSWADCCRPRTDSDPQPLTATGKMNTAAYWLNFYNTNSEVEKLSFISDNFGTDTYPENTTQTWTVSDVPSSGDGALVLSFPFFDVEQSSQPGCLFDSVKIFAGTVTTVTETSVTPLRTYCGSGNGNNEYIYFSDIHPATSLTIKFQTDSSVNRFGFMLRLSNCRDCKKTEVADPNTMPLSTMPPSTMPPTTLPPTTLPPTTMPPTTTETPTDTPAPEPLYVKGGDFATSNYPRNYNNNETYTMTIPYYPYTNERIKIVFDAFRLEPRANKSGKCDYDFVRIKDATSGAVLLHKHCGDTIPTVKLSTSNQVKVRFVSDGSNTDRGYSFTWYLVKDGDITDADLPEPPETEAIDLRCAGTITDTECCSSSDNKCGEGQGDCDNDADCAGDLR